MNRINIAEKNDGLADLELKSVRNFCHWLNPLIQQQYGPVLAGVSSPAQLNIIITEIAWNQNNNQKRQKKEPKRFLSLYLFNLKYPEHSSSLADKKCGIRAISIYTTISGFITMYFIFNVAM
jgi:hypothetical protein